MVSTTEQIKLSLQRVSLATPQLQRSDSVGQLAVGVGPRQDPLDHLPFAADARFAPDVGHPIFARPVLVLKRRLDRHLAGEDRHGADVADVNVAEAVAGAEEAPVDRVQPARRT